MTKQTTLLDDITGEPNAVERYFSIGNVDYEIDLVDETWDSLQEAVSVFVAKSRVSKRKRVNNVPVARPEDREAIRAWAILHNRQINERGRFPQDVIRDFYADQKRTNTHFVIG